MFMMNLAQYQAHIILKKKNKKQKTVIFSSVEL